MLSLRSRPRQDSSHDGPGHDRRRHALVGRRLRRAPPRPGAVGCEAQWGRPALYTGDLFEQEYGEIIAFVPVVGDPVGSGRVVAYEVPAAELAVTLHRGEFDDLDRTYGARARSWPNTSSGRGADKEVLHH